MSFRFWKRIRVAPGVTLNLSKWGGSLSFSPRGAKFTIGPRGKRETGGLPGTGLFYTSTFPSKKQTKHGRRDSSDYVSTVWPEERLALGFFKRPITLDDEAFIDGCKELALESEDSALNYSRRAVPLADGAYLAWFLAFKSGMLKKAEQYLAAAYKNYRRLGTHFSKYGISATMSLPITDEVSGHVGPNVRGIVLALVGNSQRQKKWEDALECLQRLRKLEPDEVVVKLPVAEILVEARADNPNVCRRGIRLAEGVENEPEIHAALLLCKAKTLRKLGLLDAARDVFTKALRRKNERSNDLLHALRYEQALVYEDLGRHKRARSELAKLYAEAPDYEDVTARIGL